ncbi:23S rRNA methyltransferase [Photobacterium aquae]|uniref:Ribosomal RNA large subunit methyltransferase F n=1 Tax=Photobacterium aquae TaxID=1195763 RepID=A0A0J1H0X4_9GAMM|nr:23S rRNA (adenine(1618)-N(6))-methyltransferase RlmF [Photobacterium aquae]KLV05476.1 23S rRNA methyltransferase [Photobacterium aquae]
MNKKTPVKAQSKGLHPRNPHRDRYDFPALIKSCPALAPFVAENAYGDLSVNFSDPQAVKTLNRALLSHFYQVDFWDIPEGYLCPPIPGRADYIHYIADLLADSNGGAIPRGKHIRGLDVGTGANCVYPIVGRSVYGWRFVAADIDSVSVKTAKFIADSNPVLSGQIQCRLQKNPDHIFTGMINDDDVFDFTLCNPPFHASLEEAEAGSQRKVKNLAANAKKKEMQAFGKPENMRAKGKPADFQSMRGKANSKAVLNFGGQKAELWCPGGEAAFIQRMITQSREKAGQCFWFTTLVSKKENLKGIYQQLQKAGAVEVKTIDMAQGQKLTRFVAWTFLSAEDQAVWREARWAR